MTYNWPTRADLAGAGGKGCTLADRFPITLLPYYPITLLPYYLITLLPYHLLPYYLLLPYSPIRLLAYSLWPTLCTLHPTPHTLHPIITLYPTPYTLHPTPWTLHPTPFTLYPIPHTLHPTPYTLYPILARAGRTSVPSLTASRQTNDADRHFRAKATVRIVTSKLHIILRLRYVSIYAYQIIVSYLAYPVCYSVDSFKTGSGETGFSQKCHDLHNHVSRQTVWYSLQMYGICGKHIYYSLH